MVLKQITDLDEEDRIYIRSRLDDSLFILRRLLAHIKFSEALLTMVPFLLPPPRTSLTEHHSMLYRGHPALWARSQLEEVWDTPPVITTRGVPPYSQHLWHDGVEGSPPVNLLRVHHHIRGRNRQESWQRTDKCEQCFWQTTQTYYLYVYFLSGIFTFQYIFYLVSKTFCTSLMSRAKENLKRVKNNNI